MSTHQAAQVAAGLGWPGATPRLDSLVPDVPRSGLGWPDPTSQTTGAGWADVLIPGAATHPQAGAASHLETPEGVRVVDMPDPFSDVPPAAEAARSTVATLPGAPSVSRETVTMSDAVSPDPAGDATEPAGAAVSRETADPVLEGVEAGDAAAMPEAEIPPASTVSRETALADEAAPLADEAGEPHDTPIAQAAATAVRVLGGRYGDPLPRPAKTRVMTVANQKGGVGKTTSTVNLAAALALHGAEVLVVDLDPQGNASTALGVDHHSEIPSVYDVLIDGRPVEETVAEVEGLKGLSCVPATIDLAGAEIELVSVVARESRLKKALEAYAHHRADRGQARLDYVLVDCPPSLGLLTVNALVAAEEVLIPIQCEYYALEGLGQLIRNVDLVKAHLNPALHVSTILLTMYDARTRLAAQVADEVRAHFSETVLRTTIPRSVRISEAPSYGQTVLTYDPASTGALSYLEAAREMAVRGAGPDQKETTS